MNVTCFNGSNGIAITNPIGGSPPFIYKWDDKYNQADSIATGLKAGNYHVTISDKNMCAVFDSIIIIEPQKMKIIAQVDTATQGNSDGAIYIFVTGGSPPYSFLWSNGVQTQNNDSISSGTYTYTVTDSLNCFITDSINVPFITNRVEKYNPSENIKIFPVPNKEYINIEWVFTNDHLMELILVNINGAEIFREEYKTHLQYGQQKVQIKDYSNGIYYLHVKTTKETLIKKIVLQ